MSTTLALLRCCLLCIAASVALMAHGQHATARQGLLDLRAHDWAQQPVVDLLGEWAFDWMVLPAPGDSLPAPKRFAQVPGSWTSSGPQVSEHGYGTYRLTILLDDQIDQPLFVQIDEFLTSYQIALNGVVLGGNGTVGSSATASAVVPRNRSHVVRPSCPISRCNSSIAA